MLKQKLLNKENGMKAIHKYKGSRNREHQRRIAQSLGYRPSIWDNPKLVALLQRAGIIENVKFDAPYAPNAPLIADTETITL